MSEGIHPVDEKMLFRRIRKVTYPDTGMLVVWLCGHCGVCVKADQTECHECAAQLISLEEELELERLNSLY